MRSLGQITHVISSLVIHKLSRVKWGRGEEGMMLVANLNK